jgi:hypothetical protein
MRTFFRKLILPTLFLSIAASCVQEALEDFPPIEPQGNVFALFEPGKKLSLQAAITGYNLDRVATRDSLRIVSKLYQNAQLLEIFNLTSSSILVWGANYRLECIIDNAYPVVGQIKLPQDSLLINAGVTSPLPAAISFRDTNGRSASLKYKRVFTINTPAGFTENQFFISRDNPGLEPYFNNSVFPKGARAEALNAGPTHFFETLVVEDSSTVNLVQINRAYYQFVEEMRNPNVEAEVVPGNVSVSNMSQGTGIMAYEIVYKRQ